MPKEGLATRRWSLRAFVIATIAAASGSLGCAGDDCGPFPAAPSGSTAIHVSEACEEDSPDGSAEAPYPTIGAAVAAAGGGEAILVAPGNYGESLRISKSLSIVGAEESGGVTLNSPDAEASIVVEGGVDVTLRGLSVIEVTVAGVAVEGANVAIERCTIQGLSGAVAGDFGFGVLVSGGASIRISESTITTATRQGILVSGSRATIVDNLVTGNERGGIRLEAGTEEATIERNHVEGNGVGGIQVLSSRAVLRRNLVNGTTDPGDGSGDGIVAAELQDATGHGLGPSDIQIIESNEITGNARAGVLFDGALGSITGNVVSDNGGSESGAGIWLQREAGGADGVHIESNEITGNALIGIGLTSDARAVLLENTVRGTKSASYNVGLDTFLIGDGIGLLAGSSARIEGNTIEDCFRVGIITDGAAGGSATSIVGNVVRHNDRAIVLQNQAGANAIAADENTAEENTSSDIVEIVPDGTYQTPTAEF